jgi:acyl-CoA thioesterase-1
MFLVYWSSGNGDMVSQLSLAIGEPIINLGVSGDTTRDGLARLDQLTDYDPKVVILLLGGNDAIQNIPLAETKANLARIITQLHDQGAVVLLLGVRGGLLSSGGFADMYEELHEEYGTAFVSDVLAGVFARPNLMADPIHPNSAGYQKITERVIPVLQSVIQ